MHSFWLRLKMVTILSLMFLAETWGQSFEVWLPHGARAGCHVVSLGFLAKKGRFTDLITPCVAVGSKRLRPQVEIRSQWPDGSGHWLRLTFPMRLSPGASRSIRISALAQSHPPFAAKSPFVITELESGYGVSNGKIKFEIGSDPQDVLANLGRSGGRKPAVVKLTLGSSASEGTLILQESGPYCVVFRQLGSVRNDKSEAPVEVSKRITLVANESEVTIDTWLEPTRNVLPKGGFNFVFTLANPVRKTRSKRRLLRISKIGLPLALDVAADGFQRYFGPATTLPEAPDRLSLITSKESIVFFLEDLLTLRPSLLALDSPQEGRVSLVSQDYRWHSGVRPGRRLVIGLGRGSKTIPLRHTHRPTIRAKTSKLLFAKKPVALSVSDAEIEALADVIGAEVSLESGKRRGFVWAGEESFGDWRWNRKDAGNLEYDTSWGLRLAANYLGERRLLVASRQAVSHFFRRDIGASGLPLMHGAYHRYGGLEAGHMWLDGVLAETVTGGDPILATHLERLLDDWCRVAPRLSRGRLNTRSLAWSLLFASAVCRAGRKEEGKKVIEGLYRRIIDAPGTAVPLFDTIPESDNLYRVTPWVSVGILGEALAQAPEAPGRRGAVSRFLDAVEVITKLSWRGRKLGLISSFSCLGSGGEALHLNGRASGEEALFFALGLSRAARLGSRTEWTKTAKEVCTWAILNLKVSLGEFSGMKLSQLLWVYPRLFGS